MGQQTTKCHKKNGVAKHQVGGSLQTYSDSPYSTRLPCPSQEKPASAAVLDESERLKVIRELVETERRYCGTLCTLQDTFAEPLAASDILTSGELRSVHWRIQGGGGTGPWPHPKSRKGGHHVFCPPQKKNSQKL